MWQSMNLYVLLVFAQHVMLPGLYYIIQVQLLENVIHFNRVLHTGILYVTLLQVKSIKIRLNQYCICFTGIER